jgi:hypothetical protein
LCLAAAPAAAQQPENRFTVGVNAGYQAATNSFNDRFTFELYRENASTAIEYPVKAGFLFDAGASVRVWKRLGAGLAVSRYSRTVTAHTSSSLPHPLYLDRLRTLIGDVNGTREETGVHVLAVFLVPATGRLRLELSAGPSFISVDQPLVTMVRRQETYPYDETTFTGADTRGGSRSATGFNAGVDATWMFNRTFGAGALVRFAAATVRLDARPGHTIDVDAGGAQAGAGLRVHF